MNIQQPTRPVIASYKELRGYIREDYETNHRLGAPGFQAAATYRLGVWCGSLRLRIVRAPIRFLVKCMAAFVRNFYGIELHPTARIGRRFRIAHQHGIVIHPWAVIGDDCVIRQGVTIGADGNSQRPPHLGNRVKIGAGAVLAGPITIGDDVTIAPNAVVMTNVPSGSIVAAPQSRIMSPPPRRKPDDTKTTSGIDTLVAAPVRKLS